MAASGPHFEVNNRYHSQGIAAGGSALLDAINKGKVHLAKFILDAGETDVVNTRDFKGKTPLIRTCYIKEEKTRGRCLDLLIQRGADVNLTDDCGRNCLSYACEMRCNDVVRFLVKNNVDPDTPDNMGNTPLIYAAKAGNDTAVEILIKSFRRLGLNVDHVNNDGLTALIIAAKAGYTECASLLALEGRACVSFRDKEKGKTAEEWAREQGATTPEVLPFSPKFHQSLALKELRKERPRSARARIGSGPISQEEIDAQIQNLSAGGRHLDIDELTNRLLHVSTQTSATNLKDVARGGDEKEAKITEFPSYHALKRGSMPIIKLNTGQTIMKCDHLDSVVVSEKNLSSTESSVLSARPKNGSVRAELPACARSYPPQLVACENAGKKAENVIKHETPLQ